METTKVDLSLGQEISDLQARKQYLEDNCDLVCEQAYMKQFTADEMDTFREDLSKVVIEIDDIEDEKKLMNEQFKTRLKQPTEDKKMLLSKLREGAELIEEECYQFLFPESGMIGIYNKEGVLVSSRRAKGSEKNTTIHHVLRTGTNN